ncbi:hypothetical protein F4801DRAFT_568377 [Xylaria longipes]|nr:hypothetical protein F4801DRAFT_568377 [Xylaria longipes]
MRIPFLRASRKPSGPQTIAVGSIDPAKLAQKLRSTFEAESFEVHLVHNTYNIWASRHLSASEIEECKSQRHSAEGRGSTVPRG